MYRQAWSIRAGEFAVEFNDNHVIEQVCLRFVVDCQMAKKIRDYRAEYARRIERGKKHGLSLSHARGHAKFRETALRPKT